MVFPWCRATFEAIGSLGARLERSERCRQIDTPWGTCIYIPALRQYMKHIPAIGHTVNAPWGRFFHERNVASDDLVRFKRRKRSIQPKTSAWNTLHEAGRHLHARLYNGSQNESVLKDQVGVHALFLLDTDRFHFFHLSPAVEQSGI